MGSELQPILLDHAELVIAALALVAVAGVIQWRKGWQTEAELRFKAEMVAAGLSVEEVERLLVLKAARGRTLLEQFGALSGGAKAGLIIGGVLVANMIMCVVIAVTHVRPFR